MLFKLSSKFHILDGVVARLEEHADSTEENLYLHPIYKKTLLEKPIDSKYLMKF